MKKALGLIFGFIFTILSLSFSAFSMQKREAKEALKTVISRIEQLNDNGDQKSKNTVQILGSIFYYTECLCEIVNAEKVTNF